MKLFSLFTKLSSKQGSSRVAVNTVIIYVQRFTAAILSLITTPIVLNALGVEDYGLYALTVGLVGALAFINWSLSSATQRFIAFSLGAGDGERLKRIFATSLFIHGTYALILLLIIWVFGGLLAERFLTIPESKIMLAKTILKFVSVITFINIVTVPFTGLFRAHENFLYLTIIGIIESLLKLVIAVVLIYISSDKLISYTSLLLFVSVLLFAINVASCRKLYPEVNLIPSNFDKLISGEMMSFMGWSLLGAVAVMSRNQGVTVLLNVFFGVVANAAYGIASQVNFAMGMLSQGFIGSISPQIIKSAGSGETDRMVYLMRSMTIFTVISVSLAAVPFIMEAPVILKLWLKNVPEGSVVFSRLVVVFAMLTGLSAGIQTIFDAIGRVKLYNIWVSLILILNLPIAYLLFKKDLPAYTIIITGMILEVAGLFVRLYLLKRYLFFSVRRFLSDVAFKILFPVGILIGLLILLKQFDISDYLELVLAVFLSLFLYPVIVYNISLDKTQRAFVCENILKFSGSFSKYFK